MSTAARAAKGTGGATARPPKGRQFNGRTALTIFAYLSPAFLFVIVFTYYPLLVGGRMAFHQWTLWDLTNTPFVGLKNFATLIADPLFPKVMLNSVLWVLGSLIPQFVIGFLIALALKKRFRFRGLYQALVFYPWAVSGFLIGILFRWMFNSEFGVFNDMLMRTGITETPIPWLANPDLALVSVILANIWYGVAFFAMMILAALQSVPDELHEAAALDGAGRLGTLFLVTIPTIRTTLVLTVLLRVIWIFNFPDIIYAMTGGQYNTSVLVVEFYTQLFSFQNPGKAAAVVIVLMVAVVPLIVYQIRSYKAQEELR